MVPWRGGDSQRALSCIDKLRTELNWPQRLKPPYFWACHRTAEAVRLTTPASGAGRGPRSKAFAPQVRNSCAKRNDHRASRSRTAQMTSSETAKWLSSVLSLKLSSKCCHPEPTRMTCFFNSLDGKAFQDLCRELQRQDTRGYRQIRLYCRVIERAFSPLSSYGAAYLGRCPRLV